MCAVRKTRTGPLQGYVEFFSKPDEPFHTVHVDCLGPLSSTIEGYIHVLVLIDAFTKYCLLLLLKTVTSKEKKFSFFSLFGMPKLIVADAERNFQNLEIARCLDSWGIRYHYVTPDIHRDNEQVEKYMRTIMNLLHIETKTKSEWSSNLWKIQLVLNSTFQKTIKMTPIQALLGFKAATPMIQSVVQNLADDIRPVRNINADREKVRKSLHGNTPNIDKAKRRGNRQYNVGDIVLMHRDSTMHKSKFNYEFMGPYEIVGITQEGRYEIRRQENNLIIKAAKEQLRLWPSEWTVECGMEEMLSLLEADDNMTQQS